jgi:uncharacterized protein YecT (DUF1311 family)
LPAASPLIFPFCNRHIMKNSLLTILITFAATSVFAQAADPCVTQSNTLEINACGKLTLAKKDKELNAAYQKLMKRLTPDGKGDDTDYAVVKKHLIDAQRSWIKFRDDDCQGMLALYASGTIRGSVYLGCLTDRTEQRTKELLSWGDI